LKQVNPKFQVKSISWSSRVE